MDTEESSGSDIEESTKKLLPNSSKSFRSSQDLPVIITEVEWLEGELELMDRPDTEISHWWKTLTLISYFVTAIR